MKKDIVISFFFLSHQYLIFIMLVESKNILLK